MHENLRRFYHFKQDKFMTESEYLEKFKTLVEVCDSVECDLGEFNRNADDIIRDTGADPDLADDASKTATMLMAKDQYLAIAFILLASRENYGRMLENLMNQFLQGDTDAFPATLTDTHRLLVNWQSDRKFTRNSNVSSSEGLAYT